MAPSLAQSRLLARGLARAARLPAGGHRGRLGVSLDSDKQVKFRFRFGADFCEGTGIGWYLYLDDVEVHDCKL